VGSFSLFVFNVLKVLVEGIKQLPQILVESFLLGDNVQCGVSVRSLYFDSRPGQQ